MESGARDVGITKGLRVSGTREACVGFRHLRFLSRSYDRVEATKLYKKQANRTPPRKGWPELNINNARQKHISASAARMELSPPLHEPSQAGCQARE